MAAQHIEGTLAALQTKLRTNLATNIATVNGQAPDDYQIETPASEDIVIGVRSDITRYPTIFLLPLDSGPDADLGQRVLWRHRIRIVGWLAAFQEEELALKLLRFQRAVRECVIAGRIPAVSASSTAGYALYHVRDEYGPVFQPEGHNEFIQAASSVFDALQQQDV